MIPIGELSKRTQTKVETIRYYEQIGILPIAKRTSGNYRSYDENQLNRLRFVRRSRELGFTLNEVRQLLDLSDNPTQDCSAVTEIAEGHLVSVQQKIKDLQALEDKLSDIINQCGCGTIAECRIIEALNPS